GKTITAYDWATTQRLWEEQIDADAGRVDSLKFANGRVQPGFSGDGKVALDGFDVDPATGDVRMVDTGRGVTRAVATKSGLAACEGDAMHQMCMLRDPKTFAPASLPIEVPSPSTVDMSDEGVIASVVDAPSRYTISFHGWNDTTSIW